eukprot:745842-Hanusia_phi.AAC.1
MQQPRTQLTEPARRPRDRPVGESKNAVEKMMTLYSEPTMSLPKKQYIRLGGSSRSWASRKKTFLNYDREEMPWRSGPLYMPKHAARPLHSKSATSTSWPQIEVCSLRATRCSCLTDFQVMKVEGDVVGIPGNTNLQRYSSVLENGKKKQIVRNVLETVVSLTVGPGDCYPSERLCSQAFLAIEGVGRLRDSIDSEWNGEKWRKEEKEGRGGGERDTMVRGGEGTE